MRFLCWYFLSLFVAPCGLNFNYRGSRNCNNHLLLENIQVTKYVEREIINHRQLVHPHIIQFKEIFLTQHYLCIAMEYAAGGDMFEYVVRKGGLRESEARWFFQQLIIAIDYTHRRGVANRDIKLENTLLDGSPRPLIKICDFG